MLDQAATRHLPPPARPWPEPEVDGYVEDLARRIRLTTSCRDADFLPRVEGAGGFAEVHGVAVQRMHNGVVVEKDGYCGPWMTEIIRCLGGCHEPQEEAVFARIVERLKSTEVPPAVPSMMELGSYWAYYSLWFLEAMPYGEAVALEPDEIFLEVGRRNAALNGRDVAFVRGAVGAEPGRSLRLRADSDGREITVTQYSPEGLMATAGMERVSLLLADIQGAERALIGQIGELVAAGRLRFLLVSTHHPRISGDPLTHDRFLQGVRALGGHVIAEHTVGESYSGDGLVAASFDPRDRDLAVETSRCRQKDSIFGELGADYAEALAENRRLQASLEGSRAQAAAALADLNRMRQSRLWRWSRLPRAAYARWRDL